MLHLAMPGYGIKILSRLCVPDLQGRHLHFPIRSANHQENTRRRLQLLLLCPVSVVRALPVLASQIFRAPSHTSFYDPQTIR